MCSEGPRCLISPRRGVDFLRVIGVTPPPAARPPHPFFAQVPLEAPPPKPSSCQGGGVCGGGQLAPYLPCEFRPSWLQTEQQPTTVPPRAKNRFRSKSQSPTRKEPPKLHNFFATPSPSPPAASHVPQDLGSREVGSAQQHNQQPYNQPQAQPNTLYPESSLGREQTSSQDGLRQSPALPSPPSSHPTGSSKGSRRDEGTSPIAKFFKQWPGSGSGSGITTPTNGSGAGCGAQTTTSGGAGGRTNLPSKSTGTARQARPRKGKAAKQ